MNDDILSTRPTSVDNILREWIRTEFNIPKSMSEKCEEYFLELLPGHALVNRVSDGIINDTRHENWEPFQVHWASLPTVCMSAKTVGVSYRVYGDARYAVIQVWQGAKE